MLASSASARELEDEDKAAPNPVKLDKLPPTYRMPKANLDMPA